MIFEAPVLSLAENITPAHTEARAEVEAARAAMVVAPVPAKPPEVKSPTAMALPPSEPRRGEITLPIEAGATVQMDLLNQKHAVIGNYGGKCMVLTWERWEINQSVMIPSFQTFGDFANRYKNRYVQKRTDDGVKNVEAGKSWLSSPSRITYDKVAFEPGEPEVLDGNRLNLWRGFALQPGKGTWRLLLRHIYRVLGAGDRNAGRYIVRWLAWAVQNPGSPAEAVLAFQGDEGAGKGTLARVMMQIFGAYALPVSDPNMLTGQFSGHLQHCCFLFVDEAFWAGDVRSEGRLKSLVTEPTITVRPLYVQGFQIRNMLHIMMASNNDWMVPAGHGSRRYAVFKVGRDAIGDHAYFKALNAEIDSGGSEAMLHDLLRLDLGDWHPKQVYETAALVEQKGHTLRGLDAWIEAMLQEGALPKPLSKYANRCLSADLVEAAEKFDRYTNPAKVAQKLQTVLGVDPFNTKVARGWAFPELSECRVLWERRNGGRWKWGREVSEWQRKLG
ncbi:DUF5906 domain-containing protein [Bradyrhizobium septentrionale]|uniref:primase-helicase family protein n=1 Tax=Bradyrhizobium septentrionale TaxID=1404411 RepID=UPI001596A42F|nr:primase-helicase family protein [Bradyrhizobium septentrionale]UGY27317.1 DUF5906 domain-containing protein [Bradyrhizobium septentrionale]